MLLNFIRFVSMLLLIMAATHSFLYVSWIRFFDVNSPRIRMILMISLVVLAISLIAASLAMHFFYNPVTRFFYALAGLWYGLMAYLVIASVIVWILKGLALGLPSVSGRTITFWAAVMLYAASTVYTGFGFYNVFQLKINSMTVPIKNLPAQWQGKTIAQVSDAHIGAFRGKAYLNKIIEIVNGLNPDIIAITGDLFDGASGKHERYTDDLKGFQANKGVFFISGNHEIYAGGDPVIQAVEDSGIQVIDNRIVNLDGLQIIGVGYPRFEKAEKPFDLKNHPDFNPDQPGVLLFHTPTDIAGDHLNDADTHSRSYWSPETGFETAINAGVSLQLSGHTHAGQFIPFTWLTKRIYNGFHAGLHQIGDFHIYIHTGTGTWGPPLRSGCWSQIAFIKLVKF